jgi:hypothetical protein
MRAGGGDSSGGSRLHTPSPMIHADSKHARLFHAKLFYASLIGVITCEALRDAR